MASVAKHIRRLRLEKGLTQEGLAERLHVTRQAVSNWERNTARPDLDTLQAIAAALGVEASAKTSAAASRICLCFSWDRSEKVWATALPPFLDRPVKYGLIVAD